METVTLIGIDLGKHSFHVHGQDRQGQTLLRKKFCRPQLIAFRANLHPCTIVMAACAGAHCMARQLAGFGHEVKRISPQFVRPFVKSNKNDFIDAEAMCEAASRPSMRFVTPKNEAQQTLSALHRVRESLVRERVKASKQSHGFLLAFGISLPVGHAAINNLPSVLAEQRLPARLVQVLQRLHAHFKYLDRQIAEIEKDLTRQVTEDDLGQRLLTVPGIGPIRPAYWPPKSVTASTTAAGGTSPPPSGWCRASTVLAVKTSCEGSASAATKICGTCWCSARGPACSDWRANADSWRNGSAPCSGVATRMWWRAPWPTNGRAWHGPSRPTIPPLQ